MERIDPCRNSKPSEGLVSQLFSNPTELNLIVNRIRYIGQKLRVAPT